MRFQITLLAIVSALPAAPAQQGTANAIVAKIPSVNMPSSVILAISGSNGAPGRTFTIPVTLALGGTVAPGWFQIDLTFDSTKLTFVSASAGAILASAGLGLSTAVVSTSDVRLSTTGTSQNGIASGVVAYVSFTLTGSFGTAGTTVGLVNCMSADPSLNPLSTGCVAGTIGSFTCDVNGDGKVGVADVQTMIHEALGVVAAVHDMNGDGVVNVADIQAVASAAMGRSCLN